MERDAEHGCAFYGGVYVVRWRCVDSYRAFEALAVVIVVEGLHPTVTSLNRETTAYTLCSE